MIVYAPNQKQDDIGGGFTFYRNFRKGMAGKVQFTDNWRECDIFFITGITITNKDEVYEAHRAGKKIVLRVDNVPRKSRNKRSTPHERLKEFADLSNVVVYQSNWAKNYCSPLCGDGTVIYNGVDQTIFHPREEIKNKNRYLYAYHGKNETKNFWEAHLRFQYIARENPQAEFWFIYDFGRDLTELAAANFDFWNGERVSHLERATSPEEMAQVMQQCSYFIYPSISDASPNIVLEARACGLDVIHAAPTELAGTRELLSPTLDISLDRMCEEYYGLFDLLVNQ